MAAFSSSSFQLLDSSVFLPNKGFSQFYQHGAVDQQSTTISADGISNYDGSDYSGTTTNKITSMQSSVSIIKLVRSSDEKKLVVMNNAFPMDKKRKCNKSSFANYAQSKDMREVKGKKKQKEMKDNSICEENKKPKEEGYVHVRARRGQATDRHSLAERVRREKISERMKLLQALVPGCDKVAGKALMLDEIINYVQSLQNQVEFLSMKLASVNPLESLVLPNQDLSRFESVMQECRPTTGDTFPALLENCHLLQQAQTSNTFLQEDHGQALWKMDDQIQQIISHDESEMSNTLFSFH